MARIKKWAIPDDWQESDGYKLVAFCIPDSRGWRTIVRGLVNSLTFGRLWDEDTGSILDTLAIAREIDRSYSMACLDDLINVLNKISISVDVQAEKNPCGCEGVGTTLPEDPAPGPPAIGPGEDFPDIPTYDTYKCKAATGIVDDIIFCQIGLIQNNVQGYFQASVVAVVAALGYVMNLAGLAEILAELGAVTEIAKQLITGEELNLENVRDELDANYDDLICSLYCAPNTSSARDAFMEIIESSNMTVTEQFYVSLYLINAVLNYLFSLKPIYDARPETFDCSVCDCELVSCAFVFEDIGGTPGGSGEFRYDTLQFTLNSNELSPGVHILNFTSPCDVGGECDSTNWLVEFVSQTDMVFDTGAGWNRILIAYSTGCGQQESDFSDTIDFIGQCYNLSIVELANPVPFTVTFKIHGPAGPQANPPHLQGVSCP